jgi:hypothetical protein
MITIYTVITNNYVDLMPQDYIPGFKYVCFTDGSCVAPQPWVTIHIPHVFDDSTQMSRHPKILSHKYFANNEVSVYFDGKEKLNNSAIISAVNLLQDTEFISLLHPWRQTYCDEMIWMYTNGLITENEVKEKTENLKINKYKFETHVCTLNHCIIRKNTNYVKSFELEWWDQYLNFKCHSKRDQIPFGITNNYFKSEKHLFLNRETNLGTGEFANRNKNNTLDTRPPNNKIAEMQSYLTHMTGTPLIGQLVMSKPLSV